MKAVWLEAGELGLRTGLEQPLPGPDESLVRVRLAGICGTDLQLARGYYAFHGIPGHEFVGEVVAQGDARSDAAAPVGTRVVADINLSCGQCAACLAGRHKHCGKRHVVGIRGRAGAFAEYLALPRRNLLAVPDILPDAAAVFAEPLAAAADVLRVADLQAGQKALVVGAGRLGQLIARVLAVAGADVSVLARHARQKELLAAAGIGVCDSTAGARGRHDLVVEATGSPGGLDVALDAVRPQGTLVLKSTYAEPAGIDLSRVVVDEIRLLGSRCGDLRQALQLMADGRVRPQELIAARYPLERVGEAFAAAAAPGGAKILLAPD